MKNLNVEERISLKGFNFREYQKPIVNAIEKDGYKKLLIILPRRAGKDITCLMIALRACLTVVQTVFYIFPTYSNARKAIYDAIDNDGKKILDYLPDMLCKKNASEMKVTFHNGSIIQFLGSSEYDRLRGSNPRLCIFSEYAYQNPMAWSTLRPVLAANNGVAMFISCVTPETLVITESGMKRISDISSSRSEYTELNKNIYGLNGFHNATDFYYGGNQETLKIRLKSGYEIECTKVHKLWNGAEWVKSADLKIGDRLPVQYGQNVFGNGLDVSDFRYSSSLANGFPCPIEDPRFFHLLGLIHGDGSYDKDKVTVTNKRDRPIADLLLSLGFKKYGYDDIHYTYCSRYYSAFLEYLGFKHGARKKVFPEKLLECSREQLIGFLQGVFDSDGCSSGTAGRISLASACKGFARDLQIVLLNFGIASTLRKEVIKPSKLVKVCSTLYKIEISGYFARVFYDQIGFRLTRKQRNSCNLASINKDDSGNIYPVDDSKLVKRGYKFKLPKNIVSNPSRMSRRMIKLMAERYDDSYLRSLTEEKFYYSDIVSIEESSSEVFDFVIPDTHSFFSNGFISHNTPFSKNHFYDLYQLASNSDDWFCYRLTVDQTGHMSEDALASEKLEMSHDMFMQEYYVSFDQGVQGSVFAKVMNEISLNNQITDVPWERSFPVHTSWDIGYADKTAITFFQIIGQSIHIIDYYENNQEGLEHYIKYLDTKPYSYGKHIAPHDMENHSFSTGVSRREMAARLGLRFRIAPKLPIADGLEAAKVALAKCYIDAIKCKSLVKSLNLYRYVWDEKRQMYTNKLFHGSESHAVDSFRYLAVTYKTLVDGSSAEEINARYNRVMYGRTGGRNGNGFNPLA